jgi:BirA family biotin operon repressor/biotin-[acetyl-CoA-carboxylase] ligase
VSASIKLEKLQESLRTKRFGKCVFFSRKVGSTSDWAKKVVKMGAEEGTVTAAEIQTAGRGRLGREWISPRGGLWFSIILRPDQKAREAAKLVFVASLAVAEVLKEKYGLRTETKWPNDVLVSGKKICGILAEMSTKDEKVDYVILGVGVNANFSPDDVFPKSLRIKATSIENELGKKIRLESFLKALLEKMEMLYDQYLEAGFSNLLEEWKKYAEFLGHRVVVRDRKERLNGLALDVDMDGTLVLKLQQGTIKRIHVGDIAFGKC